MEATKKLRVLIVDGVDERRGEVTRTVHALGHDVVGSGVNGANVGQMTVSELADVAFVIVGEHSDQALESIRAIVREAACPVIAILDVQDGAFIDRAARLGIFSYIAHGGDAEEMQSSIDVALERFAEYHALEGAFGRRAITERAKGVLMERHHVDEERAFQMLRDHARGTHRKIIDVADSILTSHLLLPRDEQQVPVGGESFAKTKKTKGDG